MSAVVRWSGRSLTAVLLSTAVAWGSPVAAPPAQARAAASIVLTPDQGSPGTPVVVSGSCGSGPTANTAVGARDNIRVRWDDSQVGATDSNADGAFELSFSVPDDASAGPHPVTVDCVYSVRSTATATFTVAPLAVPALTLSPAEGPAGTPVRVDGSGFGSCPGKLPGTVSLLWDGSAIGSAEVATGADGFTADITVPADATPEAHDVRAVCDRDDRIVATAPFTVDGGGSLPPDQDPVVTLVPDEGQAGTAQPLLSGSGFNCSSVDLLWDGGTLGSSEVSEAGTFETRVQVAADEPTGDHAMLVRCASDPGQAAEASFTVTAPGPSPEPETTGPGPTPSPVPSPVPPTPVPPTLTPGDQSSTPVGWVVGSSLLGVGLLAAAGAAMLSHRQRGPRWVHEHVSTRLRPSPGTTDVIGPPGHSVRLEPRTDPGEQTVQEEDR
ncbi:hypothetical protein J7E99_32015 [Streptomyces sp. ISL-44]|nr:hypothetical protein [Streptomyces sp. ISL-44]